MAEGSTAARQRKWHDSGHASLCVLGAHLRRIGFFRPLAEGLKLKQKVLKYTPVQKLEMLFVALLPGAKAVSHTGLTLRLDRPLRAAFGLPGCADQSVIADTLDAATEQAVAALRQAVETLFRAYSQAQHHDFTEAVLVLDVDLSPLPASAACEGSTRGYMGRWRSKTGRKLVRVRAAGYQETVWEDVLPGRTVETLTVLQAAVTAVERLLSLEGDEAETEAKRARPQWRLDAGWASEELLTWLLGRGYQVTGKFKSTARARKLGRPIATWEATSSPGREVAAVLQPVALAKPTQQYAVRTPSKEHADGCSYAVLFTTRLQLSMQQVVEHYDDRAGMEADLKGDKRGLGLGLLRKHKLAAQQIVVLLMELAHNVLVWARRWLATPVPRLATFGIVRLIQEVWAVPGRVKLGTQGLIRVRPLPNTRGRKISGARAYHCSRTGNPWGFWAKSWQLQQRHQPDRVRAWPPAIGMPRIGHLRQRRCQRAGRRWRRLGQRFRHLPIPCP